MVSLFSYAASHHNLSMYLSTYLKTFLGVWGVGCVVWGDGCRSWGLGMRGVIRGGSTRYVVLSGVWCRVVGNDYGKGPPPSPHQERLPKKWKAL